MHRAGPQMLQEPRPKKWLPAFSTNAHCILWLPRVQDHLNSHRIPDIFCIQLPDNFAPRMGQLQLQCRVLGFVHLAQILRSKHPPSPVQVLRISCCLSYTVERNHICTSSVSRRLDEKQMWPQRELALPRACSLGGPMLSWTCPE